MSKIKRPRLGRGLSSLISAPVAIEPPPVAEAAAALSPSGLSPDTPATGHAPATDARTQILYLPINQVSPNPYQPRRHFDESSLDQLASSIRQDGLMQPIIVRPRTSDRGYELVAGERRWRAAERAGLPSVPAIVKNLDDRQLAEWAVIENLQREDLDPLDRAHAFARLADQFGLTHQEIADRIGLDRTTVTNFIRLLDLHENIQELVRHGQLTGGHVRCLLGLHDPQAQQELAKRAAASGWSVRKLEEAVRRQSESHPAAGGKPAGRSAHLLDLERQIAQQLNTKVHIKPGRKKNAGTLMIDYYDLDQFDALMSKLGVSFD